MVIIYAEVLSDLYHENELNNTTINIKYDTSQGYHTESNTGRCYRTESSTGRYTTHHKAITHRVTQVGAITQSITGRYMTTESNTGRYTTHQKAITQRVSFITCSRAFTF